MSTCQDICLISVWGLEDWNPHYGHHQLFPSSLQVWRDPFEMRNIKAGLTELLRWCINSSHLAKSPITITVDSITHSNLLLVQFQRPFHTSFFSLGDSKGKDWL